MRTFPFLLSLILLPLFMLFPVGSPVHATATTEPLIQTTSPIGFTLNGPPPPGTNQGGVDMVKSVSYMFFPNGRVSYTDLSGATFTIMSPLLKFSGLPNMALPLSKVMYNSTTVEYSISTTLFGQTASLSIDYRKIPGSLNLNVTLSGTLSTGAFLFLGLGGRDMMGSTVASRPTKTSLFHGPVGFDWSDTQNFNPSVDNATDTLSWSLPPSFTLDPLTVDATGTNACTGTTCTLTISTSHNNDLILVAAYEDSGGFTVTSVTDSVGNSYKPRAGGGIWVVEEWYGTSPGVLSNDIVTVTLNGSPSSSWGMAIIAISGYNLNAPFEMANPDTAKSSTCSGWPTVNVNSNDMVVAFAGHNGVGISTPDPGFTILSSSQLITNGEYEIFTARQTGIQPTFAQTPCSGGATWGMVVDIVCVAGQSSCYGGGGQGPFAGFNSVNVAGIPLPPQLADQGVISFMFFLSAGILVTSIDFQRKKKPDRGTGF